MAITDVVRRALAGDLRPARGHITAIEPDGRVRVSIDSSGTHEVSCDLLQTGANDHALTVNDYVLVVCAEELGQGGVILGRIRPASANQPPSVPPALGGEPQRDPPRELVIEAGEELTLKCGEASIKITHDGKIVIRGEHILSRAKGTQRITGGTVAIN